MRGYIVTGSTYKSHFFHHPFDKDMCRSNVAKVLSRTLQLSAPAYSTNADETFTWKPEHCEKTDS